MILSDLSTRKRHDTLWLALGFVLQDIPEEQGTAAVAELLRGRLSFPATELPMVMTWLKKVARLVPEASQTGAVVKAYGRYGRRWIWAPRRLQGLKATGVWVDEADKLPVDASDW